MVAKPCALHCSSAYGFCMRSTINPPERTVRCANAAVSGGGRGFECAAEHVGDLPELAARELVGEHVVDAGPIAGEEHVFAVGREARRDVERAVVLEAPARAGPDVDQHDVAVAAFGP